jgi:hypothetical protein
MPEHKIWVFLYTEHVLLHAELQGDPPNFSDDELGKSFASYWDNVVY